MRQFRAGIIGVGKSGCELARSIEQTEMFKLCAIFDKEKEKVAAAGEALDVRWYDDPRQMILKENLDMVILAIPTHACGEYVQLAAKQKIHLFKQAPLARTLPEASKWHDLMSQSGCQFFIGAPHRFAPGYRQAFDKIQAGVLGNIYLVRGEHFLHYDGQLDWRGDPKLAGGGVVIEQAYGLIDLVNWILRVPEKVFCLNTNHCAKRVIPTYLTEDSAILSMHFASGLMGNIITSWMAGPEHECMVFHGVDGSIKASLNEYAHYAPDGQLTESKTFDVSLTGLHSEQLSFIANYLVQLDDGIDTKSESELMGLEVASTSSDHLANVSVIEAAYLSVRTQMPEEILVYGSVYKI
jgi:predicted dehydrogenase